MHLKHSEASEVRFEWLHVLAILETPALQMSPSIYPLQGWTVAMIIKTLSYPWTHLRHFWQTLEALTNRWGAAKVHNRIKAVQNLLRSNGLGGLAALPTECPALAKEDLRAEQAWHPPGRMCRKHTRTTARNVACNFRRKERGDAHSSNLHAKPQRKYIYIYINYVPCTSNTPEKMMRNMSSWYGSAVGRLQLGRILAIWFSRPSFQIANQEGIDQDSFAGNFQSQRIDAEVCDTWSQASISRLRLAF